MDICNNRKAKHEYFIHDAVEAGIVLHGTEIKVIRQKKVSLEGSYVSIEDGEVWLINSHIDEYKYGNVYNHEPKRKRKLLLKKVEIRRMEGKVEQKGFTIVPLRMYLKNGRAKVEIAVAEGKKLYDKRQVMKKKDAQREIERSRK